MYVKKKKITFFFRPPHSEINPCGRGLADRNQQCARAYTMCEVNFQTVVLGSTRVHVRRGWLVVPLHGRCIRDVLQVRCEAGETRLSQRAVDGQPTDGRRPVETGGPPETGRIRGATSRRVRSGRDHVQRPQLVELCQLGHLLFHRGHDHR